MTLARFTPSVLDGETLERLFVQRHHLLDDVMAAARDAGSGDERRHKLFVGPRGAGKTHLISLVNHRVRQARADGLQVALSWLMEDPWDIETYDDLLDQILENLAGEVPKGNGEPAVHRAVAENGPIVLLIENLDQILTAIGADGQRRLRALLENDRPILLIATSTRLSDDLLSQAEPFYGFFDEIQLEPFSVEQAADMLWHVADYADDKPLTALLESPHASARLATIAHLAGGQPRVWALLGTGLTDTGIDDMVDTLLGRFDDLTPYYQEQLARLSPSERKAVRRLADADRPLTVRDLAGLAKTDQRSMSKTISDLRKRGWVRRHESILTAKLDARLSYYELAEPLARIAFQMKAAHGEPIRLVVDFLSSWFKQEDLLRSNDMASGNSYRKAAFEGAGLVQALVRALAEREDVPTSLSSAPQFLSVVEGALAWLEKTGDGTRVMALPASIAQLVAERLRTTSVVELRVAVAEFAVMNKASGDWQAVLDGLAAQTKGEQRARALAALIVLGTDTPGIQELLLIEINDLLIDLPLASVRKVYGWLAVGLAGTPWDSPELYLDIADRLLVERADCEFIRIAMRVVAALDFVRCGDTVRAEAVARAEYRRVVSAKVGGGPLLSAIVGMANVLVAVGKPAEALVTLDVPFAAGTDPPEVYREVLMRAKTAIAAAKT